MSLTILFDKSTFQGLNYSEIIELHRYYNVNVSPLLVSEILGDLSKEEKEGRKAPDQQVRDIAIKMFPYKSYTNMDFHKVLIATLLGEKEIPLDNRPLLSAEESINSDKGKGYFFTETEEEKSIKRWKNGEFEKIEEIISENWRIESQKEGVINEFKEHFSFLKEIKIKDQKQDNISKLKELKINLDEKLNEENQTELLKNIIDYFEIPQEIAQRIFHRFETGDYKTVQELSSYAVFCYSISALYYVGINNSLFGERKTNLVDLQYLYYLPFTKVFTTNDNFLKNLFFAISDENVYFITLTELKSDFAKFMKINTPENWSRIPPDKDTKTYEIWNEVFDLKRFENSKPSEKELEKQKARFEEILSLHKSGKSGNFTGEPDFVIKETFMSPDDPCVCGSGLKLKDCHLKK